jgi:ferredoxin
MRMTYVINEPCIATKDASCVEVCPVDCIHPTPGEPDFEAAEQLYIDLEDGEEHQPPRVVFVPRW